MSLLKGSLPLKIIALVVAVLTYFFIRNEMTNTNSERVSDPSYKLIKLTAKSLPVKVRLVETPPEGYRILADRVSVAPGRIVVIGPEALLEEASNAETTLVDVSDSTKTTTKKVTLESVAGRHLTGEPYFVEVTVPIEPIPAKEK